MNLLHPIRVLTAAPLLGWIPGWLAWRAFGGEAGVSLDGAERIFARVFTSLLITTALAAFLAELGALSLAGLLAGLASVCVILLWKTKDERRKTKDERRKVERGRWKDPHPPSSILHPPFSILQSLVSIWSVGLLAILVLAAFLFFRPAESILVMDDAGVYVIRGLMLARTGALDIRDTLLSTLSPAAAGQLLPFVRYQATYIRHEGAFYIWQWGRGLIRPSFFHFPSIWMAVLALLAGPRAVVWAAPLAGLLALAGFGLLVRRLLGPAVALAATLLLTVSFPQVWYARYPTSEVFFQAWLVGGLFLLALFLEHRLRLVGAAAGVALGQLFLIRVDAWVAVTAIGLGFGVWELRDRIDSHGPAHGVGNGWFVAPFALTLGWAGLHAALFATPYIISLVHLYLTPAVGVIVVLGAAFVLAVAGIVRHRPEGVGSIYQWVSHVVTRMRSNHAVMRSSMWWLGILFAGGVISIGRVWSNAGLEGLRWLSWYVTPVGLAAALGGLILLVRRGVSRPIQAFLLVAFLYALIYLPAPRTRLLQPWGVRRFVPAILPVLILLMAYLGARFPVPGAEQLRQGVRIACVMVLAVLLGYRSRPLLAHAENAGAWDQMSAFADLFEPRAVVLFNHSGVGQAVSQPLTYLYDRPAFVLQSDDPDAQILQDVADQWMRDGRSVYVAVTGLAPWLVELEANLQPAGDFTFRFPRLERTVAGVPRDVYTLKWPIDLYQLMPAGSVSPVHRLDMGPGELTHLREGFYGREVTSTGVTFRWTDGSAHISLPVSRSASSVRLRVSGPPAGVPRRVLRLSVDGKAAGAWALTDEFVTVRADVPAGAASDGRLEIGLDSGTWVPRASGTSADNRRLGVVVDSIEIED